ncbi:MAG: hypothetical protein O3A00_02830 [Planctomycetota bacterium]|nr:hypothetical protein [Planctomycetota bacterium]
MMQDQTPASRREFLTHTGLALTAGIRCSSDAFAGDRAPNSDIANSHVAKSQSLPSPPIQLPTDRLGPPSGPKKRIAAIATTYWKYSHADDIITKFIEGYSIVGRIHAPHCTVKSLYIEQFPETDIGRGMAARYKIPLYQTPAEALTLGGDTLAVDGVLLIGEHGDYPLNDKGQKLYPRRRLFEDIVKVFRKSGRSVPVFNDKHLSYSWDNAKWMYDQSLELKFPLMAGSSVPTAWRLPPLEFRPGVQLDSAIVVSRASFESYGFHCLEFLQEFVQRRRGGETGVKAVQALSGEAAWQAAKDKRWPAHLIPAALKPVPESRRSVFNFDALRKTTVFLIEYSDEFRAAVCLNFSSEFTFAADVAGQSEPVATYAYLPKPQRDHFSFLCNHIETMFRSREPSYPVERTLLVTGILDALHDSRAAGGKRIATPQLAKLTYKPA